MSLQDFKDSLAKELYGMTTIVATDLGICISCKKPPTYTTEAGRKEYGISGLCEPCFDAIFADTEGE